MIDFSALVLRPAMVTFAQGIMVTPVISQPGLPPYEARGSFNFKAVDVQLESGVVHSTNQPALGVRLADFPVMPMQEDQIVMPQGSYIVADVILDGQGGADLMLRNTAG